jgi:hypothetical protein
MEQIKMEQNKLNINDNELNEQEIQKFIEEHIVLQNEQAEEEAKAIKLKPDWIKLLNLDKELEKYYCWYAKDRNQIRTLVKSNSPLVCYLKNYFGSLFVIRGKNYFFAYKYYYNRKNAGYSSKSGERIDLNEAMKQISEAKAEGEKLYVMDNATTFSNCVHNLLGELTK